MWYTLQPGCSRISAIIFGCFAPEDAVRMLAELRKHPGGCLDFVFGS
jgi:hypothetical protein